MKIFDVCYDLADYEYEHTRVFCDRKSQVRRIMDDQFGKVVKIRYIKEIKENERRG